MAGDSKKHRDHADVDRALQDWRQGDVVLGQHWFVHRLDPSLAITDSGRAAAEQGADLAEDETAGLVILSQTCDVVRSCSERPYVEVCALVEVDQDDLEDIERGRRPAYAFLPRLADRRLVADLDRTMTVVKPVVAGWQRTAGHSGDEQARAFAEALARKRARFAFPDDFNELVAKLKGRLRDKHARNTQEGRALRALREIRVSAAPSWESDSITLTFWFIRHDTHVDFEGTSWSALMEGWLHLVPSSGRFREIFGQVATLDELTAADFVHSDRLDLDHISRSV